MTRRRSIDRRSAIRVAVESLEIRNLLSAAISGSVYNDNNNNGTFDAGDQHRASIGVYIDADNDGAYNNADVLTFTDGSGNYDFSVAAGTYVIRVGLPTHFDTTEPGAGNAAYTETVIDGDNVTGDDFGIRQTNLGSISGHVFNTDGTTPFDNITVFVDANSNGTKDGGEDFAVTDSNGAYSITGVAAGTYDLAVNLPAGYTATTISNVAVVGDTDTSNEDFNAQPTGFGIIRGHLYRDVNANGTNDAGDVDQAAFGVYIDTNNNGVHDGGEDEVFTDGNSDYDFMELPGTYKIRADTPNDWRTTEPSSGFRSVAINAGDDTTIPDLGVVQVATVSGTVTEDVNADGTIDAGDNGLRGVRVFLDANSNGLLDTGETSAVTDANGDYTLTTLPGSFDLIAQPTGGVIYTTSNTVSLSLNPGDTNTGNDFLANVRNDFNGDGQTDLVVRDATTGANDIWLMNGNTKTSTVTLPTLAGSQWVLGATGDFNADGLTDLVFHNNNTGTNYLWLMNGTTRASVVALPTANIKTLHMGGAGDFNSDGDLDIVFHNTATGANFVWTMTGSTVNGTVNLPTTADKNYDAVAVADFNNDGHDDILFRHATNGKNVAWLMNNAAISSQHVVSTTADARWKVFATGDINHDGETDILWRNDALSKKIAWLMSDTTISSQVNVS